MLDQVYEYRNFKKSNITNQLNIDFLQDLQFSNLQTHHAPCSLKSACRYFQAKHAHYV
jgi:hypothetical protein